MKTCSHCKNTLPLNAFSYQSSGKQGRRAECKECVKRYSRQARYCFRFVHQSKEAYCIGVTNNQLIHYKFEEWLFNQSGFQSIYEHWVASD